VCACACPACARACVQCHRGCVAMLRCAALRRPAAPARGGDRPEAAPTAAACSVHATSDARIGFEQPVARQRSPPPCAQQWSDPAVHPWRKRSRRTARHGAAHRAETPCAARASRIESRRRPPHACMLAHGAPRVPSEADGCAALANGTGGAMRTYFGAHARCLGTHGRISRAPTRADSFKGTRAYSRVTAQAKAWIEGELAAGSGRWRALFEQPSD
jgi:hypothetical protein